jgi:CHAT domain-containing protein
MKILTRQVQMAADHLRPRLHWCPAGAFVFLPLHAAGIWTGPLSDQTGSSDYVVSSYTPTISALSRCRRNLIVKRLDEIRMLLKAAPLSPGMVVLDNVRSEVANVADTIRDTSLTVLAHEAHDYATIEGVTRLLPHADIVHLACHGVQDPRDPLQSGFCLQDGKLTVQRLMDLKPPLASLAFLSACETAKGAENQPDQTVHLAAAMLFCGFRSVIGTMW